MAQAKNLYALLRAKYPANEYALMAEVSDAAGFYRSNSADFIAVNLWPSRGLSVNGIELKSFRNDWLGELKKPSKAENIFKYCDYFWLLTTDDSIAKIEEIPVTWGWMTVNGARIKVLKDAPKLTPVAIDKHFFCATLKRAVDKSNFVHVDSISERVEEAKATAKADLEYSEKRKLEKYREMEKLIKDFEEHSGISFGGRWHDQDPKQVGEAIKFITDGGCEKLKKELEQLKTKSDYISKSINQALNVIEQCY